MRKKDSWEIACGEAIRGFWIVGVFAVVTCLIVLFWLASISLGWATYKPEYAKNPQAIQQWFFEAKPTAAEREHRGWSEFTGCCNQSERFLTKFTVDKSTGEDIWSYQLPDKSWQIIPERVIHYDGIKAPKRPYEMKPDSPEWAAYDNDSKYFKQLRAEGVLFILGNEPVCFWPPESGG